MIYIQIVTFYCRQKTEGFTGKRREAQLEKSSNLLESIKRIFKWYSIKLFVIFVK